MPSGRLVFLDYLRVFAFASVLVGHKFIDELRLAAFGPDAQAWLSIPARLVLPWVQSGGVGVVVFFLVSGYIITHVLRVEPTGEFLIRRAFRIYPLYAAAVLIEHSLYLASGSAVDTSTLLLQLSLFGDFFGTPYALSSVEWTLRVEIIFYLVMAFLSAGGGMRVHLPRLLHALVAVALLCLVFAPFPTHASWAYGYLTIYGPFLLLGAGFYLFQVGAASTAHFAAFALLIFGVHYPLLMKYQPASVSAHFALLATALFGLAFGLRERLPSGRLLTWLSGLTYAVYLFHNWAFDYFRDGLMVWGAPRLIAGLGALACLLAGCSLAVRLIEKPGIRLGRRLTGGRPAQPAGADRSLG